jgi:hypothetical protein
MSNKPTIIDKESLVPVGLLGVIIGCAVWMSMLFSTANANSKKIAKLETKSANTDKNITQIRIDIAVIKAMLQSKEKNKGEKDE